MSNGPPKDPASICAMFSHIAGWYDVNNWLHSLGRDRVWRRAAVRLAEVRPHEEALDVACGTGDMVRRPRCGKFFGAA